MIGPLEVVFVRMHTYSVDVGGKDLGGLPQHPNRPPGFSYEWAWAYLSTTG